MAPTGNTPVWGSPGVRLFVAVFACGACTIAPATPTTDSLAPSEMPPAGYGTLLQEEITITVRSADLELHVTPLSESVIRVAAPDVYTRLAGVVAAHGDAIPDETELFLVSFYSDEPDRAFLPNDVHIISRGLRARPSAVVPITPSWGQQRVRQQSPEMAVYGYGPGVALDSDLVVAYGTAQSNEWAGILTRVRAERSRALARSRGGSS